ncbi:MAG: transporter substrate-binding domain-containing protein [Algicola sp.]|nr:transporter substrate-binding domain-containing protein [Algicola sp.]
MIKTSLFTLFVIFSLTGCGSEKTPVDKTPASKTSSAPKTPSKIATQARSWAQIKQSGVLKALKLHWEAQSSLPRSGATSAFHVDLLTEFARQHQLRIQWHKVDNLNQMFEQLAQFKADIIPRHLSITDKRQSRMSFTLPLAQDEEVLIGKKGMSPPDPKTAITVAVPEYTAYIDTLKKHYPKLQIIALKDSLNW